ncbi:hypothetical protein BGZ54_001432 [Gamsiella multidivaricata]|nr:hypothetical protein BGZ54_001432 [Gamsiella multidivaricata]
MLDLATAKAENITGLYFAKQMNRRSVPLDFSSSPLGTFSSPHSSIPNSSETGTEHGMNQKTTGIRIDIDTPSPVSGIAHGLRAGDSTGVEGNSRKQDTFPPKSRRVRTFTAEPLQNNTHLDTSISPSADTQASVSSDRPSCTPIRGQHRRSHSASHFFHLSSLKRHSPAQFNLALCYEHGQGGVGKDLEKALNFYQQAADQGHTKASYNIGCICYNHGEVSKAMTWFERAGKCSVRGLVAEATYPSLSEHSKPQSSLDYPLPKQTTLPHELEDMLLGDMSGASGPFVAYLPAILCLALLCRQGVQLKDGAVILKQDYDQSVELLQSILQKASSQSHPGNERDVLETTYPCREPSSNRATDTEAESASASFAARKRGSQGGLNPSGHTLSSTLLSTSCPSLPLRNQSTSDSFVTSSDSTHSLSSQTVSDKTKRPSTVQDEADDEVLQDQVPARTRVQGSEGFEACNESLELHGYDDHESCSVTLAHQLLKVWKPVKAAKGEATPELAAEMEKRSKRILRHHLLYITNPILGRNLYNLGVLYDLHLGDAAIAIKCYRSAYHNSHGMIVPPASKDLSAQPGDSHQQQERQHSNLVTRINSAWNLGVLHVRCKEWKPAQEWFLRAQQDVHMLERQQHLSKEYSSAQASEAQDKNSVHGQKILGNDNDDNYQAPRTMRRSLVNVVPHTVTALPSDSPGKRHAREHGLLMHLGSIPNGSTAAECGSDGTHKQDSAYRRKKKRGTKGSEAILEETIRTDAGKVAWVLRWVESHIEP